MRRFLACAFFTLRVDAHARRKIMLSFVEGSTRFVIIFPYFNANKSLIVISVSKTMSNSSKILVFSRILAIKKADSRPRFDKLCRVFFL